MKRLLFCLLAAGVALSTSAFTSVASKPHFQVYYYVLTTNGTYIKMSDSPDMSSCQGTASYKCFIGYSVDKGISFSTSAIPSGSVIQSTNNGLYIN